MRFRYVYMGIGSILVILVMLTADPDNSFIQGLPFGSRTMASLIIMLNIVLYVAALHLSRRALLDYLDLQEVIERAMQSPEGAGRVAQAVAIIILALAVLIYSAVH